MRRIYILLLYFACPAICTGQEHSDAQADLRRILSVLKELHKVSYLYEIKGQFADGSRSTLKGEILLDHSMGLLYNHNDSLTTIYDGKYYYCANHMAKEVAVLNVGKNVNKLYREHLEHTYLQNGYFNAFVDSVILRYGKITRYEAGTDTVNMELGFNNQASLQQITFCFSKEQNMIVGYSVKTFTPYSSRPSNTGRTKGTTQLMLCRNFRKIIDVTAYTPFSFFTIQNKKVQLKKYAGYTLLSRL